MSDDRTSRRHRQVREGPARAQHRDMDDQLDDQVAGARWTGTCQGCGHEREIETRYDHAARVLCDECAGRPHRPPPANGLDEPSSNGAGPPAAFEFLTLAELRARVRERGPRRWLLRRIWPAGDYGVHAAEMKAQKSWNAVDLAVSVASGTPWLGHVPVDDPGPVLMFWGEGGDATLVRRIDAVCEHRGLDPDRLPIIVCCRSPHLSVDEHRAILERKVAELRPRLVIVDPFYLAARGANGADLYAMGALLEHPQRVCQHHGAALIVITHFNRKDGRGATRITGAGPAEWGRVLIAATVKSRRTDQTTTATTVITELDMIGGEIPDTTLRVTRTIRADDPDDLDSPLHLTIAVHDVDPDDDSDDDDMPPARRKLLDALHAADAPRTGRQLVDHIAEQHGHGLTRQTVSVELNALLDAGLADSVDQGNGRPKLWITTNPTPSP